MDKERKLYDAFVDTLLSKVQNDSATPKELEIVMNFLKNNNKIYSYYQKSYIYLISFLYF